MDLEQFRKITANLPGNVPIVIPTNDHDYRPGVAKVTKAVSTDRPGEIRPYFGEDPELYGLSSNIIVATRTLPVVEVA